jgi:RHS repeat-associated protein
VLNYAYWPAPGGGTVLDNGNGGSIYYEHKDWLGSARVSSSVMGRSIIDDRAFAPYGEIYGNFGSTAKNENIFGGGMIEGVVTGTFDADNREYNGAAQGRWISPDPAGAGWNQYAYTTNPNSGIDPTGLSTWVGNPHGSLGSISGYGGTAGFAFGLGGGATSPWTISNGEMIAVGANFSWLFANYNPSIWLGSGAPSGDPNSPSPTNILPVTLDSNGNVLCPGSCPGLGLIKNEASYIVNPQGGSLILLGGAAEVTTTTYVGNWTIDSTGAIGAQLVPGSGETVNLTVPAGVPPGVTVSGGTAVVGAGVNLNGSATINVGYVASPEVIGGVNVSAPVSNSFLQTIGNAAINLYNGFMNSVASMGQVYPTD